MSKDFDVTEQTTGDNRSLFFITFHDKQALYNKYMPFVINGGLFVPTQKKFHLGDEVYLLLKLLDDTEKYTISGRVMWMTPQSAQRGRPAGIGVQFENDEASHVRNKIEGYLAGFLKSEKDTDTM